MRIALAIAFAGCGGTATGGEGGPQKVFVELDGITLTRGSEDAQTNTSSAIEGTLSPFRSDKADREARIAATLEALDAIVAPFRLEVVTERPDVGRYDMIVIGGSPTEVGLGFGVGGAAATDCSNAVPNKVVVVFANAFPDSSDGDRIASLAIAGLGTSQGIPSSDLADDCLCWSGTSCANTTRCTFGGPGTPVSGFDECKDGATMDPTSEFARVYGTR
ncbi:MAG: hypothetical protein H0V17_22260 [Deltaproteobacteria bacterium]|nr:hypothetical protein [Deltaproteobacteria bacterium]